MGRRQNTKPTGLKRQNTAPTGLRRQNTTGLKRQNTTGMRRQNTKSAGKPPGSPVAQRKSVIKRKSSAKQKKATGLTGFKRVKAVVSTIRTLRRKKTFKRPKTAVRASLKQKTVGTTLRKKNTVNGLRKPKSAPVGTSTTLRRKKTSGTA